MVETQNYEGTLSIAYKTMAVTIFLLGTTGAIVSVAGFN
jgi:hypothetical protein